MVDFFIGLNAANNALKLARDLQSIDKEMGAADYKLKIAELTSSIADLKNTLTDAREEASEKDKQISKLQEQLRRREEETVVHKGYRYLKGEDGQHTGRPYCQICEQKDGALIMTQWSARPGRGSECPRCQAMFMPGA